LIITTRTILIGLCAIVPIFYVGVCPVTAAIWDTDGSQSDVQAKINLAARGDTVLVPSGAFAWANTLSLTKGVNLAGAGRDNTFITSSSAQILMQIAPDSTAIANEEIIRVTGFTLDGNNTALVLVKVFGAGSSSVKPFKNLAFGDCRFRNTSNVTSSNGVFFTQGQIRGVIFGNIFDRCNVILKIMGNDDTTEWSNGHFPQSYGTSDNLYFENNTIQYSTTYSGGDPGWIESGQGGRLVVRYNTFDFTHATCSEYWDIHGFQNFPGNGQTGTMVVEYYGNTLTNTGGYRWINHRGGWGLFYNNVMTGANSGSINASEYGEGDLGGSGCTIDVPGALGNYICEINNTYVFNNTLNGTVKNMIPGSVYGCGIAENANYYNYNASFDGTVGIGRGATAPTMSATDGVAYWVNATATPSVDPNVVQAGHLYKRVSGAWVDYYQPYTYPHPLVSGGGPEAPQGLHIVP
jgi:hypothetical protein